MYERAFSAVAFAAALFVSANAWSQESPPTLPGAKTVSPQEAKALIASGAQVYDVRKKASYVEGRLPKAKSVGSSVDAEAKTADVSVFGGNKAAPPGHLRARLRRLVGRLCRGVRREGRLHQCELDACRLSRMGRRQPAGREVKLAGSIVERKTGRAETMNALKKMLRSLAVRLSVGIAVVTAFVLLLVVLLFVSAQRSHDFVERQSSVDVPARRLMSELATAVDEIDSRMLGVTAKIYSAPGIADKIPPLFTTVEQHWTALAQLLGGEIDGDVRDAMQKATLDATQLGARLHQTMSANKKVDPIYDDWLDIRPVLAKGTRSITVTLDAGVAERLAGEESSVLIFRATAAAALLIGLAILSSLGWLSVFGVARPLVRMREAMDLLARGDTTTSVPFRGRRDEIGSMAGAVEVFRDGMIRARDLTAKEAETLALGKARASRIDELTQRFDTEVGHVLKAVASASTELQATSTSMTATAEETRRQASAVAAATEQASTNVQTVASASEELSSSIREIGRQVIESNAISRQAGKEAETTNFTV
ncbi:MAG: HAMP domain-containing protein, partial [Alphaproteobacteria bacterium]|nr:HAMP domain-containing protein [Alphaproteobacteria bacterium]